MPTLSIPTTADAVAALLREASLAGQPLTPVGQGTKAAWHTSSAASAPISTQALQEGFAHYAGDLVATLPAGLTLGEANHRLATAGQWLPLDPAFADRATIGGIVSANDSGPRRLRYGAPRDLIVGIELALTDGRVVKAGGRVVKNVAGYDLSRLFCGAHGSLGVVTSATFKLAPLTPFSCTLAAEFGSLADALAAAQAIAHSPVTPSAVELEAPSPALLVRFETTQQAAEEMASVTRSLIDAHGGQATLLTGEGEAAVWQMHDRLVSTPLGMDDTLLKTSVVPSAVAGVLDVATRALTAGRWDAIGRATLGVMYLRINGSTTQTAAAIEQLRSAVVKAGGHTRVLQTSAELGRQLSAAPTAPAAPMMQAIKQQFDPMGILPRVPDGR